MRNQTNSLAVLDPQSLPLFPSKGLLWVSKRGKSRSFVVAEKESWVFDTHLDAMQNASSIYIDLNAHLDEYGECLHQHFSPILLLTEKKSLTQRFLSDERHCKRHSLEFHESANWSPREQLQQNKVFRTAFYKFQTHLVRSIEAADIGSVEIQLPSTINPFRCIHFFVLLTIVPKKSFLCTRIQLHYYIHF